VQVAFFGEWVRGGIIEGKCLHAIHINTITSVLVGFIFVQVAFVIHRYGVVTVDRVISSVRLSVRPRLNFYSSNLNFTKLGRYTKADKRI
jgi:hypothetical protein